MGRGRWIALSQKLEKKARYALAAFAFAGRFKYVTRGVG
jgi:hypothetical protein